MKQPFHRSKVARSVESQELQELICCLRLQANNKQPHGRARATLPVFEQYKLEFAAEPDTTYTYDADAKEYDSGGNVVCTCVDTDESDWSLAFPTYVPQEDADDANGEIFNWPYFIDWWFFEDWKNANVDIPATTNMQLHFAGGFTGGIGFQRPEPNLGCTRFWRT